MRTFLHILGTLGLIGSALMIWHTSNTNSAIHEIEAILSLILTAVCWSGVGIIDAVNKRASNAD